MPLCDFCDDKLRWPCKKQDEADNCERFAAHMRGIAEKYNLDPVGDFLESLNRKLRGGK